LTEQGEKVEYDARILGGGDFEKRKGRIKGFIFPHRPPIHARDGIQKTRLKAWIPAFAGMTAKSETAGLEV
jgi:hypothetical protein